MDVYQYMLQRAIIIRESEKKNERLTRKIFQQLERKESVKNTLYSLLPDDSKAKMSHHFLFSLSTGHLDFSG